MKIYMRKYRSQRHDLIYERYHNNLEDLNPGDIEQLTIQGIEDVFDFSKLPFDKMIAELPVQDWDQHIDEEMEDEVIKRRIMIKKSISDRFNIDY